MAMMHQPELYSIQEARKLLGGISRNTIYQLLRSGELASVIIGCQQHLRLIEKLPPQTRTLLFVPGRGVGEILLRLGSEADLNGHSRRRMSARTSDARLPAFLSSS
jgi:excisionase family DNA binding protein